MALTLTLVAIGALGSAVVSFGSGETAVVMVTAWRFLLGAGLGGIFPLSAVANASGPVELDAMLAATPSRRKRKR